MRIKIVLSKQTVEVLWALGASDHDSPALAPDEAIVEVNSELITNAIDLFGDESLDESIRRLGHLRLRGGEE